MKAAGERTVRFEEVSGDFETFGGTALELLLRVLRGDRGEEGKHELFAEATLRLRGDLSERFDEFTLNAMFIAKGRITNTVK